MKIHTLGMKKNNFKIPLSLSLTLLSTIKYGIRKVSLFASSPLCAHYLRTTRQIRFYSNKQTKDEEKIPHCSPE